MQKSVVNNSALCVLPLLTLPIAAVTVMGGPCAGVRGVGSGIVLFVAALVGITCVVIGWIRWIRSESRSLAARLTKLAAMVVGVCAVLLNAFFALLSGMELIGMGLMRLRGY